MKKLLITALLFAWLATAFAHPGRTDKSGCHKDKRTGQRHCH